MKETGKPVPVPPKGEIIGKFKDPYVSKRPPVTSTLFCSEYLPKIKGEHLGLSIGAVAQDLREMWGNAAADDRVPPEQTAAELKEKEGKDLAAYRAAGRQKRESSGAEKSKKKKEGGEDDDDGGKVGSSTAFFSCP